MVGRRECLPCSKGIYQGKSPVPEEYHQGAEKGMSLGKRECLLPKRAHLLRRYISRRKGYLSTI